MTNRGELIQLGLVYLFFLPVSLEFTMSQFLRNTPRIVLAQSKSLQSVSQQADQQAA